MNKKTIALTLLSLASVFALSTTAVKAEENGENAPVADVTETTTTTNLTTQGDGISISATSGNLQFEEFAINGNTGDQSVNAQGDLSINVADLRGTREGWTVTAYHEGLSSTNSGKEDELERATITLDKGSLTNTIDPETNNPRFSSNKVISTSENNISIAESGEGMGLWSHTWAKGGVTLTIPAIEARDMYEGNYSTTITWKLTAAPLDDTVAE